jgi:MerR family transcriptional regulator, light-induced transcriptional regulator
MTLEGVKMLEPVRLDRRKLSMAYTEIETIRKTLPKSALSDLAKEVVKRVANNLRAPIPPELRPTSGQIDELCHALLSQDPLAAIGLIEQAQRQGFSYETLCQIYLAGAATRLGEWWDEDRLSFYKVTIAASGIYAILRTLRLQRVLPVHDLRRTAIFASVPDDTHTLGITVAADMARDRGWDITLLTGLSHDALVDEIEGQDTALIGISASGKRMLPAVLKLIVALRLCKPKARILICGNITSLALNLDSMVGADIAAADFETAISYMEKIVTELPQP